jgi:TatD DNase family protein
MKIYPEAEDERRRLNVLAAASSADFHEFIFNEELAKKAAAAGYAKILPCYAVHPQMPAELAKPVENDFEQHFITLNKLASEGRIAAVGECGFDLFNAVYKATEKLQDEIFTVHLETALRFNLPVIIHARKAMHKIFYRIKQLTKCRAVIFHSWQGSFHEGESLIKRNVNAFFSFCSCIMRNHKHARHCCSLFPADRLLVETDAPFQSSGRKYSQWMDLPFIIEAAAALRREAGSSCKDVKELELQIEYNFYRAFSL